MSTEADSVGGAESGLFRSLIRAASTHPDNHASILADPDHECPYPQLADRLEEIQRFLAGRGVAGRDCIAIELNNSVRGALAVLAVVDAGFSFTTTPVPGQGPRAGATELRHARFARWVLSVSTAKPTRSLADSPAETLLSLRPNPDFDPAARVPAEDDPRMFFRTSGSMGAAKLVVFTYRKFYVNTLKALAARGFDASYRLALPTPIFHIFGLSCGLFAGVAAGVSIDLQERSNLLRYFEREADFEPNTAYVTPSLCEMLVRGRRSPRPYRYIVTGGDCISEATFKRSEDLHGPILGQYGATELGIVAAGSLDMPFELRCRTVGRPIDGVQVRIMPIDDHLDRGELQIQSEFGFEGYVDLDGRELIPPRAFDGAWYRTGDFAALGADGTLAVLGRCDLSVNRQGVLLPLAEVESRMRGLASVDEVAVAPGPENIRGRSLVAFCVIGQGCQTTANALRASYARIAPAFSVPEVVRIVSELPKLANGKVDRQALARLATEVP